MRHNFFLPRVDSILRFFWCQPWFLPIVISYAGICLLNNMIKWTLLCRYRSRRSRTPSVSRSPRYRARRYSRSPVHSRSPVEPYRSRASPHMEKRRSSSRSHSASQSKSSVESESPRRASRDRSRSSSRSPDGKKGLVSYGDGSPDSDQRWMWSRVSCITVTLWAGGFNF